MYVWLVKVRWRNSNQPLDMSLELTPYDGTIHEKVLFENPNQCCLHGVRAYKMYSFNTSSGSQVRDIIAEYLVEYL